MPLIHGHKKRFHAPRLARPPGVVEANLVADATASVPQCLEPICLNLMSRGRRSCCSAYSHLNVLLAKFVCSGSPLEALSQITLSGLTSTMKTSNVNRSRVSLWWFAAFVLTGKSSPFRSTIAVTSRLFQARSYRLGSFHPFQTEMCHRHSTQIGDFAIIMQCIRQLNERRTSDFVPTSL